MTDKTVRVRITEPTVVRNPDGGSRQVEAGKELDLPVQDAIAVVGAGRAVTVTRLPNALKGEGGRGPAGAK